MCENKSLIIVVTSLFWNIIIDYSYAFLFVEGTKETYYNVKINLKLSYMSICNEDNKFKKLYIRKKDFYVGF